MRQIMFAVLVLLACTGAFAQQKMAAVAGNYDIGDIGPGGGYVFYYSEAGFPVYESDNANPIIYHYLECSPVELGSIMWCPCGNSNWCDVELMDGIGAGKLNTKHILTSAHYNAGFLTPSNCAAKACSVYVTETTGAGEWYLPSRLELALIYENLRRRGRITGDSWHWSSSRDNFYNAAWAQRFGDGLQDNFPNVYRGKYSNNAVLAVRAF